MGMGNIMKIFPVFLVVMFFSGAIIFTYMAWATFRGRDDQLNLFRFNIKPVGSNYALLGDGDQTFTNLNGKPSGDNIKSDADDSLQGLGSVDEEALFGEDLNRKIDRLKMKVISKLRRHILNGAKLKGHINEYGVNFTQLKSKSRVERKEVLCRIKNLKLNILDNNASPVFQGKVFPTEQLFNVESSRKSQYEVNSKENSDSASNAGPIYRSCAIVPNSAALDGAKHGVDIDSHDFVLRFNNAPTLGFEEDVGALTSMRIVNSQVVTKARFGFPHSSYARFSDPVPKELHGTNMTRAENKPADHDNLDALWEGSRKYLIWDPCNYSSTVEQWYSKPDFPFFSKYFNLTGGRREDRNRFYILDCRVIWKLWELLQEFTFARIYGNPPTSGFIGIIMSLQKCERVNIYEYVPSIRESEKCHYYGKPNETNPACTYGSWHPVSAEKLFFLGISDGTDKQTFLDGVLTVPGVSQFKC